VIVLQCVIFVARCVHIVAYHRTQIFVSFVGRWLARSFFCLFVLLWDPLKCNGAAETSGVQLFIITARENLLTYLLTYALDQMGFLSW